MLNRKNARIDLRIFNKCQDRSESEVLLKIVTLSPPDYRIQYCFRVPPQIQPFCDSPFRHRPYPSVSDPRSTLQTIPYQIQHFAASYYTSQDQLKSTSTTSSQDQNIFSAPSRNCHAFEIPDFSESSLLGSMSQDHPILKATGRSQRARPVPGLEHSAAVATRIEHLSVTTSQIRAHLPLAVVCSDTAIGPACMIAWYRP